MAILIPYPKFYATDENGEPLVGGKLFTYEAGTTTKRDTYTDASGGVANTNPVILDSSGLANVWIDPAYFYKFVLSPSTDTDPPTDPIWTVDDIGVTTPEGLRGLTFVSDTGSTADSDPGAGKFKWNNATQSSATVLYFDDLTSDGVSLTTFWASLAETGFISLQQSDASENWQLWKWTALPVDGTGYRKFTVTLQAFGGAIPDAKSVLTLFTSGVKGAVVGPASSTDNALVRWDGTTGKLVQNSNATLDDTGNLTLAGVLALPAGAVGAPALYLGGDTTTGLYRPASNQFATTVSGTQRGLWSSSGLSINGLLVLPNASATDNRLLIGTATDIAINGAAEPRVQSHGTTSAGSAHVIGRWNTGTAGALFAGVRSKGATIGTHAALVDADDIFRIEAQGSDGTAFQVAAQILAEVDGPVSPGIVPGSWLFYTANASGVLNPWLRIDAAGNIQQYALLTSATNYSRFARKVATTTLNSVSGATVTATNLIPAKARLDGVNTKVTIALGTGGGTTGYQVGDGSDADRWGNVTGTATTTDTDGSDATADPGGYFNAANNVVLTANGGNFNGTGSIRVDAFYNITEAD